MQINFGILCDGETLESWQLRSLNQLRAITDVRPVLWMNLRTPVARVPLPAGLTSVPTLTLLESTADAGQTVLARPTVERLQSQNLDFILSFLTEACPPELLETARHGVWAYQFGDWTKYRGKNSGFWEVYHAEAVSSALLVRLQSAVDSVVVLREGYLRANLLSCARNREQLLARITHWPAQVCIDIRNGATGRLTSRPLISSARVRGAPTRVQLFNYKCRIAVRMVRVVLRSLFRHDQWNVGWADLPIASFLHSSNSESVQWLKPPKRSEFLADPFGVWRDGRLTILYEHFSYRDNRGIIAAIEPAQRFGCAEVQIGPQPAVHLSYPFLVEVEGRLLCIPESHAAERSGCTRSGVFRIGGSRSPICSRAFPSLTRRFFVTKVFGGSRVPNPIPRESPVNCICGMPPDYRSLASARRQPGEDGLRSARPGGTPFYDNGVLYRPAQDCSKTYGGRVVINRIVTLTTTAFEETPAAVLEPDPGRALSRRLAYPLPGGKHHADRRQALGFLSGGVSPGPHALFAHARQALALAYAPIEGSSPCARTSRRAHVEVPRIAR